MKFISRPPFFFIFVIFTYKNGAEVSGENSCKNLVHLSDKCAKNEEENGWQEADVKIITK